MTNAVRVRKSVLERLAEEAKRAGEKECCGLLAGSEGVISEVFPARNALESGKEFEIAPAELFSVFRAMRGAGLEHLGIYHSHPKGPSGPSARDIEQAYYPDAAYFVISPGGTRAFRICEGKVEEREIQVL
jgi:proteasome lid subunit RPN8/RPN11